MIPGTLVVLFAFCSGAPLQAVPLLKVLRFDLFRCKVSVIAIQVKQQAPFSPSKTTGCQIFWAIRVIWSGKTQRLTECARGGAEHLNRPRQKRIPNGATGSKCCFKRPCDRCASIFNPVLARLQAQFKLFIISTKNGLLTGFSLSWGPSKIERICLTLLGNIYFFAEFFTN